MTIDINGIRTTSVYAEEALVVDLQSLLHTVMIEKGMSRSQLAQAMGVSKARITQLFSDDTGNFTVRVLARALHALGERLEVSCPTFESVRRRVQLIQQCENIAYVVADFTPWNLPANDFESLEVARASGRSGMNSLIARSMQRTTDLRRAA